MADSQQASDQYAAVERLYSERRWAEVEASAAILLAEIQGELRSRVLLLLGHTRLYGYNDAGIAAEHYRQVLAAKPEALLLGIAQEGLNQCLAAQEPSPSEESSTDAMPWLEQITAPEVASSGANSPTEISAGPDQPIQPTLLSPKESAELAKGLLGVVIRPN